MKKFASLRVLGRLSRMPARANVLACGFAPARKLHGTIIGENATSATKTGNLSKSIVGQHIEQPYELTVTDGWLALWHSCFFQHDRLYTSTPFANNINLKSQVLPFAFMLFQTASMSHVEEGQQVLDLGFEEITYVRPGYSGDTFKKHFYIKRIRPSRKRDNSTIVTLRCELYNQRNQLCFSCDKVMLYPYEVSPMQRSKDPVQPPPRAHSHLLEHIKNNVGTLPPSATLTHVHKQQLILHTYSRPTGLQMSGAINTLFRQAHPMLMNLGRYAENELVLSGGTVVAQTISASSRALFEILYEEVESCRFMNKVSPNETIGAISYIEGVERLNGGIEELSLVTFGLRETDVMIELAELDIPESLFTTKWTVRSELEEFVKEHCPVLSGKIAVVLHRKIVRQSPFSQLNIPLL